MFDPTRNRQVAVVALTALALALTDRQRAGGERSVLDAARRTLEQPVLFPFDRFDLTADTRTQLEAKVTILTLNPSVAIRIDGHTDERGSDEYNLALGQRRAGAVQRYLLSRGIAPVRLSVRSLGEEAPTCGGSRESCWAHNRRAEFQVTAGQITTAPSP